MIFSGFVNDTSWFLLGAMLIGAMAAKSGLPQRIGNFVISRVGVTYSRVLLGLIIIDLLLTFVVPSGAAVLVIMASLALAVMKLFDAGKGSNIGRGLFVDAHLCDGHLQQDDHRGLRLHHGARHDRAGGRDACPTASGSPRSCRRSSSPSWRRGGSR